MDTEIGLGRELESGAIRANVGRLGSGGNCPYPTAGPIVGGVSGVGWVRAAGLEGGGVEAPFRYPRRAGGCGFSVSCRGYFTIRSLRTLM